GRTEGPVARPPSVGGREERQRCPFLGGVGAPGAFTNPLARLTRSLRFPQLQLDDGPELTPHRVPAANDTTRSTSPGPAVSTPPQGSPSCSDVQNNCRGGTRSTRGGIGTTPSFPRPHVV